MQLFAREQPFQDFSNLNDPPTPATCLRMVNWGPLILRHAQITMEHGLEHGMTFGALWRLSSCVKTWWIPLLPVLFIFYLATVYINQITKTMHENHNICPLTMEPRKTRISQYILENLSILAEDLGLIYFNFNWPAAFLNPRRWDPFCSEEPPWINGS